VSSKYVPDTCPRDHDAELLQLTDDPEIAPARVLSREAKDESDDLGIERVGRDVLWTRVRPVPANELPVPAHQRCERNEEGGPTLSRKKAGERRQHDTIGGGEPRSRYLATGHRELVTKDRDLDVCVPKTPSRGSSSQLVLMDQTSESVASSKAVGVNEAHWARFSLLLRRALAEGAVRTVLVVMSHVLGQYPLKVPAVEAEEPVEALSTGCPHKPFGERVRARRTDGRLYDPDAFRVEQLIEAGSELGVPVPDHEPDRMGPLGKHGAQVARLLGDPLPHWVGGHAREVDPPGTELDEEQHVEALQQHRVDDEEVASKRRLCLCS
jgi:hypothetical protein